MYYQSNNLTTRAIGLCPSFLFLYSGLFDHQHTLLSYGSMIRYNNLILIRRNLITILNSKIAHFPFITNSRIILEFKIVIRFRRIKIKLLYLIMLPYDNNVCWCLYCLPFATDFESLFLLFFFSFLFISFFSFCLQQYATMDNSSLIQYYNTHSELKVLIFGEMMSTVFNLYYFLLI
jgi:hypothetical protein